MNDDCLYFNINEKKYYYVGNSVCSVCGCQSSNIIRILIFRNKIKSNLHILCMNPDCANKVISRDIYKSAIEHTKAIVIDETPEGCLWVPFKRKFELAEGRYENNFIAGEFHKNELCNVKDNAFRSKRAEFSLNGANVVKPKEIVANNDISFAEMLENEKKDVSKHELKKMIENIAQQQINARLESIARLEEQEKQRRLI